MADEDMQNYFSGLTGQGLGVTSIPNDWSYEADPGWAPQAPAQVTVNPQARPDVGSAYARDTGGDDTTGTNAVAGAAGAPTTTGAGLGGIFGGLGSLFGGGTTATPAARPGSAPGMNQSMIGLGLGMLGGNIFNKWGPALRGYQTGAAADLARQQQVNTYGYQQQELGLRRAQMAQTAELQRQQMQLQRDIAFKPQVQFRQNEDTGEWEALQYDPIKGTVKNVPIAQADKIAEQQGVNATYYDPIKQQNLPYPPGVNRREFRKDMAKVQSDLAAGKANAWQLVQQFYYKYFGQAGGGDQTTQGGDQTPKVAKPGTPSTGLKRQKSVGGKTYYQDYSGNWFDKWPP
jgi:hypothetical protein